MQLIALRDFRNNLEPRLKIANAEHDDHIHMGAVFTIGVDRQGKDIPDFENLSSAERTTVQLLKSADAIGDATDEKVVARVKKEIAAREKVKADEAKTKAAGSSADVVAQFLAAIKGAAKA